MDTILRSKSGYREKRISEPSSHLFEAVPEKPRKSRDFWKLIAAVILTVFAAVLMLRGEFIRAAHSLLTTPQTQEEP